MTGPVSSTPRATTTQSGHPAGSTRHFRRVPQGLVRLSLFRRCGTLRGRPAHTCLSRRRATSSDARQASGSAAWRVITAQNGRRGRIHLSRLLAAPFASQSAAVSRVAPAVREAARQEFAARTGCQSAPSFERGACSTPRRAAAHIAADMRGCVIGGMLVACLAECSDVRCAGIWRPILPAGLMIVLSRTSRPSCAPQAFLASCADLGPSRRQARWCFQ